MKKRKLSVTILILFAVNFFLFSNITQAKAQCNIVWWGVESGSVPTDETSATETATSEAFNAIFGFAPGGCQITPFLDLGYACTKGIVVSPTEVMLYTVSLDLKCWNSGIFDIRCDNEWDVVCSGPCDEAGGDSDSDGICDDIDQCIGTSPDDIVNADGCSIDDMCACDNEWKNHGAYVKCVAQASEDFVDAGLITEDEKDALMEEKASSDCGKVLKSSEPDACSTVDRFLDNGDGTVTDCRTDLIWLQNANCYGSDAWFNAMSIAAGLNSGECGLSDGSSEGDWHLATKEELQGIGTDPPTTWYNGYPSVTWTMPGSPFVSVQSYYYWSSTEYDMYDEWLINMTNGLQTTDTSVFKHYVLPVRSGN